jgi:Cdc6-like AAA superfamily ATPase
MTDDGERPSGGVRNPFSPVAVVTPPSSEPPPTTVPTQAIREVSGYLADFLSGARADDAGIAIAVVGGVGYGKSHVLSHLLDRVRQADSPDAIGIYLDAKNATFTAAGRSFLDQIDPADVKARIIRFLGTDRPPTDDAIRDLRRAIVPSAAATDRSALATALGLLLQPDRTAVVWQWLSGTLPAVDAAEHGLPVAADPETLTVDAMSAIARLYGRTGGHLVVALDDVDRLLGATNRTREASAELWSRLVETFVAAGTFLAVTGLPDLLPQLDDRSRERIGPIVMLPPFARDDIETLIQQSQLRTFGEAQLLPFTRDVSGYLAEVSGGVPRRVIRMCFYLYREAVLTGARVTYAMVRSVLHLHFDAPSMPTVQATITRVLTEGGNEFHRDYLVPARFPVPVDFWVFSQEHPAGCAVLVTESVLKAEAVDDLAARLGDLRQVFPDSAAILVIVGHLATEFAAPLASMLATDPVVYDPHTFTETFTSGITSVMRRLELQAGLDGSAATLDRLHRQQAHTQRMIQHLTSQIDGVQSTVDTGLSVTQRLAATSSEGIGMFSGSSGAHVSSLPPRVRAVFADALNALGSLWRFDALLGQSFGTAQAPAAARDNGVHWLLRPGNAAPALGTSALLQRLIEAFQAGVAEWYRGRPERHDLAYERELDRICGEYDTAAGLLPLFELKSLASFNALSATSGGEGWAMFDGLGARVSHAVRAQR